MAEAIRAFTSDPIDRSGLSRFLHIIRSSDDPERAPRSKRRGKSLAWEKDMTGDVGKWADAIAELLGDGRPRTFNRIVLELTGLQYTADVAAGKAPDLGLWAAVADGRLEHTIDAPVLFRKRAAGDGE